ncbi:glycosyltransferase family 4 protein [Candidatus Woesearchaeota archaeon]|nr:glycosyltransferase family 4 protein [Candidatus Woesearchaeota archaeon]
MKLYFIASTFRGFGSGKGYWFHKAAELLSKKIDVKIFSMRLFNEKPANVNCLKKKFCRKIAEIRRECKKNKAVLHFPQYHLALFSFIPRFFFKCPIVIGPNTLPLQIPNKNKKPSFKERRIINMKFDMFTALSDAHKIILENYGIPANKIKVIKPGIELDIFKPMPVNRKKFGIEEKDFVFAFINRFAEVKQFDLFEKAMMQIIDKHKHVKFLIIGKKLPVQHKNIINIGFINRMNLPKHYNLCDVYLITSEWETYSIAGMEALSCGKPCIMTDVGGNPEQIIPGKNGFLVKKDCSNLIETMENCINNPKLIKQMSKNARELALKNFNWDGKIKELIKLYQNL